MKHGKPEAEELQALSRLFSYPDKWPEAADLRRISLESERTRDIAVGENGLKVLQGEYVRLFINALPEVPCPPYGSVYLEGVLMGQSTVKLRNLYLSHGFQTDEMADHIAVELEFLAFLTTLSTNGFLHKDYDSLLEHLRLWTPEFFQRVKKNDKSGFYTDVCRYAKSVIL